MFTEFSAVTRPMSGTYVVIPEKIRMATRVHVAVIPIPEEKDKKRSGIKLVGNTLW